MKVFYYIYLFIIHNVSGFQPEVSYYDFIKFDFDKHLVNQNKTLTKN